MNAETLIIPRDAERKLSEVNQFLNCARVISVTCRTDPEYLAAGEIIKELKAIDKEIDALRVQIKDPIIKQGKAIDARFRPALDLVADRIKAVNQAIWGYERAQDEKRQKAQAEADRLALEQQRKLQQKATDEAAKAEQYRQQGRNDLAEKRAEKAAALAATAESIQPVAVAITQPRIDGLSKRETWRGNCTDKAAAMAWAVQSGMVNLFQIDQAALNAQARACKGEMKIPGVEWIKEISTVSTR